MKNFLGIFLISLLFVTCKEPVKSDITVVATNSWTGAFARAAGAKNVVILAPFDMEHPSEYELRAADIPLVVNAKLLIYAGYETMIKRIQSGMNLQKGALLQIETDYSMATIEKSVMQIAMRLGTEKIALQNIDSIRHLIIEGKGQFDRSGLNSTPVLVNFFQQSMAKELGFEIAGTFGPAPLEAGEIARLAKVQSGMILDNEHNPVGKLFQKVKPDEVYRQLLNFPGLHGTSTLQDVIRYNIQQLNSAAALIK